MGASFSGKTGGNGRGLYFDPESGRRRGKEYNILSGELVENMRNLIDVCEAINMIWVYKCPLSEIQPTQAILNHQFVVFKTLSGWWSIERNSQGIAMQRSKNLQWVRDHLKRNARNAPVVELSSDKGMEYADVLHLLIFLEEGKELDKMYNLLQENCQNFAKRIFDEFAAKKKHGTIMGAG